MTVVVELAALGDWIGREVACSDWCEVDQARIQRFADATGDQQWIHVDPERARRESPFRTTIAHGYLTLSLLPGVMQSTLEIRGVGMALNYGLDRVRFPAPLPAGSRVRARLSLDSLTALDDCTQACWTAVVEPEAGGKPVCVAQVLVRYYPNTPSHTG